MPATNRSAVLEALTEYTRTELLGPEDAEGLTAETPLLDWGILNSLSMARLAAFLHREVGVQVPASELIGENFKDLNAITDLVLSLRAAA
ncbi:phosphopantetheine-binding protein [Kitasatospora sp. NPDC001540]|uniref:acyl carrier protein n=1 Tax=Kitasatospora TaxID=2063 RepID=UPI002553EC57|nr:acyl carrier protein [Kitasatospora phosalacinea]